MTDEIPYLEQLQRNIQNLLADKKYKEAYQLSQNALTKYPQEKQLYKLQRMVEDAVHDENKETVKNGLKELKQFWNEDNYTEILKRLRRLLELDPNNEKIKRQYLKAETKYKEKINKLQGKFEKEESTKLDQLLEENQEKLIDELFALEKKNPGNRNILAFTKKYRNKLIQQKIEGKQELIYSTKYDAIANFITELKKIDPHNPEVLSLEKTVYERKLGHQLEEKSEFVYKGTTHLETLMKLKKFDSAIKVATEILEIDQANIEALKILEKAKKEFYKQTRNQTITKIEENKDQLRQEYQNNKSDFIKV